MIKRIVNLIPVLQKIKFELRADLKEWKVNEVGTHVSLLMPAAYVNRYLSDDRKGKMTGIDHQGCYEFSFAKAFLECVNQNTVFFDVGAAHGFYSILAQKNGCTRIFSFEPDPFSNWVLRKNNKKYCGGNLAIDSRRVADSSVEKNSVSIDDFCESTGITPTLIKMDIEGFEYFVIQGMKQVCTKFHPIILIEFHNRIMRDKWGVNPQEILTQLNKWGYRLKFNGHHWYTGQNEGAVDDKWYEEIPNDINFAVWAKPS